MKAKYEFEIIHKALEDSFHRINKLMDEQHHSGALGEQIERNLSGDDVLLIGTAHTMLFGVSFTNAFRKVVLHEIVDLEGVLRGEYRGEADSASMVV